VIVIVVYNIILIHSLHQHRKFLLENAYACRALVLLNSLIVRHAREGIHRVRCCCCIKNDCLDVFTISWFCNVLLLAGEEIQIAASNAPTFSASKTFKEKCNPNR